MEFIVVLSLAILAIAVLAVLAVILVYNGFISSRNEADNAWAQIDVQLKRRADLIPKLVETVKGYVKHEKTLLENITKARSAMIGAGSIKEKARLSNVLTQTLKSLFAVAENYPKLRANENFLMLQEEISGTENKIAYARQRYNDTVMEYNNRIQTFPGNVLSGVFKFQKKESFEAPLPDKEDVKVGF